MKNIGFNNNKRSPGSFQLLEVIQHAITLVDRYSKDFLVEGYGTKVQRYESEEFSIIYTTPFSGLEAIPGRRNYMVDIWDKNRKVLNINFSSLDKIDSRKTMRAKWVFSFMSQV